MKNRWFVLALLTTAELLGMSLWFTASAVSPHFRQLWSLSAGQVAWLTTIVQLGFVAGTAIAATLNLADIVPSRFYFAIAAILAAAANALLVVAPSFAIALALRFATGLLLAGVYPPAMKMIATWFESRRGLAIGMIVGGLTLGKALPYLVSAMQSADFRVVILLASAGSAIGAAMVALGYEDGPHTFPRRAFSWSLVPTVMRHRETRIAIVAYLGHMWELYAAWATISAYFLYAFQSGSANDSVARLAALLAFSTIAIGGVGSVIAGIWADKWGRENVAIGAMLLSAACALTMGWIAHASAALVISIALVWGVSIVADSAQFSALVTEVAPPHAVGTALTLQTSLGFALTALSIWITVVCSNRFGWGVAFSLLAAGPLLGALAMLRLKALRAH